MFRNSSQRSRYSKWSLIFILVALSLVMAPLAVLNVVSPEGAKAQDGTGSIDILKWLDTSNDGIRDAGEPLMEGWEFTITGPETHSGTTGASGHLVFSDLAVGTYTVTETVRDGWTCTTTNPLTNVDVVDGQTTNVEFGDYISPGIAIDRSPASPFYVVNDGTMSERFGWEIRYWSTADYYTFDILAPDGITVVYGPIYFGAADDPHSTFTPPPGPAPIIDSYAAENSPIVRDLVTNHWDWPVPLGATPGFYTAEIKFYSLEVGRSTPENTGTTTFEVRNKAHLRVTIDSPANGTTVTPQDTFTVTATVTDTGGSHASNITATISISGPASTAEPLTKPVSDHLDVGQSATVSWELQCTDPGDVTITVTAAGFDHTSGSPIPLGNINPDTIVVTQRGPRHPPSVPAIGSWGAALMAAVFGGSLIWVLVLRRRRRTV
jgi:hypothetical protein